MAGAIPADAYFPEIPGKPGKLRKWGRGRRASGCLVKTADLKHMALGVGKGVVKISVHLDLAGGIGNGVAAVPAYNGRAFKRGSLVLFPGLEI